MKYLWLVLVVAGITSCAPIPTSNWLIENEKLIDEQVPSFSSIEEAYRWVYYNVEEKEDTDDYWQNPIETLVKRSGDCEDSVILFMWFCSMYFNVQPEMVIFFVEDISILHAIARIDTLYYDFNNIISQYNCIFFYSLSYNQVMTQLEK